MCHFFSIVKEDKGWQCDKRSMRWQREILKSCNSGRLWKKEVADVIASNIFQRTLVKEDPWKCKPEADRDSGCRGDLFTRQQSTEQKNPDNKCPISEAYKYANMLWCYVVMCDQWQTHRGLTKCMYIKLYNIRSMHGNTIQSGQDGFKTHTVWRLMQKMSISFALFLTAVKTSPTIFLPDGVCI